MTVQRFRICKNTVERERKGACSPSDFRHILRRKFVVYISKCFQLQGAASPPDPLTRGFAPGPHWGLRPQTPVIGSRSRARHKRQRSSSFFVRTGSLIVSYRIHQSSAGMADWQCQNVLTPGHTVHLSLFSQRIKYLFWGPVRPALSAVTPYNQGSDGTGTHRNAVPVLFLEPGTAFRFFFTT